MSDIQFTEALKNELLSRGLTFDVGELMEFVEDVWTRVKQNPDVNLWADRFAHGLVPLTV